MSTISLQVYGKVQGVYYRASTRDQALALGLTGWVRNMPDGTVLLHASGTVAQLKALEAWCKKGPRGAEVSKLVKMELPEQEFENFIVVR
ncbi:acylphosphatase [Cnuella takakiae]|uniref:acylphosphatase n=1 Tax=Cnuella takakiae TaxID=1302690 RepID=A0A1M4XTF9_9BACT|nr:acylphosphatase [Cnuella takakiae]OLY92938.1 hypothetical protein BUE76_14350 [Cnuella takakiae]SHE96728.1 acylphosphatase [Cnuella takakiae]